jgi:DNA-binding NtrC family response regulator
MTDRADSAQRSEPAEHPAASTGEVSLPLLRIAPDSETVCGGNQAAAGLLNCDIRALVGRAWHDLLVLPPALSRVLADAILAGLPADLPPSLVALPGGREIAVACHLFPGREGERLLLVDELWREADAAAADTIAPGDTVAVLGAYHVALDAAGGVGRIDALLRDMHTGLMQIVRGGDLVASPSGRVIWMILRDTDLAAASDIGGALVSHLQPLLQGADGARLHLGLARAGGEESPLATLVAANNALLVGAFGDGTGAITLAGEGHLERLAAASIYRRGLFDSAQTMPRSNAEAPLEKAVKPPPPVTALETGIEGYVEDNMEGAIDQAVFLAGVDMPVAVIGPRGTGKLYVARIIHQRSGGGPDGLEVVNCRELRGRQSALRRISAALDGAAGRTVVFKSPHLLHPEVQRKLARQLSTRVVADSDPPRYLAAGHFVALFPDDLDRLVRREELDPSLASVFGGYPIRVPPLRDRGRAVLRWAHKILGQESARRDRPLRGFTPDAERALLQHDWPGNISELRQAISDALDHTDKDWVTPVDLGLFAGDPTAPHKPAPVAGESFLAAEEAEAAADAYTPTTVEQLSDALGEALLALLQLDTLKPLGVWLDDEVVLAACRRFRGNRSAVAGFLQTRNRNVARWLPKIEQREEERSGSLLWQEPRRLVQAWISEVPAGGEPPQQVAQDLLLAQVLRHCSALKVSARAGIMGVSTPTYQKRLQEIGDTRT